MLPRASRPVKCYLAHHARVFGFGTYAGVVSFGRRLALCRLEGDIWGKFRKLLPHEADFHSPGMMLPYTPMYD